MISTSFIHACDDAYMIESTYEDNARDIYELTGTLDVLSQQRRDLMSFGIFTESKEGYYTESVADGIEKIGQKILDILKKFKEFMDDLFRKWKERSWQKKDDVQKLREIERKDPKLAARMEVAIQSNQLDFRSFKDINDFYKNCDEVLKEIEKKNVDPKSIRGKWEKAKSELNNKQGNVSAIATALGLVAAATGLMMTYENWKGKHADNLKKEGEAIRDAASIKMQRCSNEIDVLLKMKESGADYNGSTAAILAEMANEVDRISKVEVNKRLQFTRHVESQFATKARGLLTKIAKPVVDKYNSKAGYEKFTDNNTVYDKLIKERSAEHSRLQTVINKSASSADSRTPH